MQYYREEQEQVNQPQIPPLISSGLQVVPNAIHTRLLVEGMNHLLAPQLAQGELDFLEAKTVSIELLDGGIRFLLTKGRARFQPHTGEGPVDLVVRGRLNDFVQLALGKEDPDTLFFQRRISLEGNVELGLEVKNLLYGLEMESLSLPAPLRWMLQRKMAH